VDEGFDTNTSFCRCDADPEVLSDYVLALLRHDASDGDLQNLLKEQLEDFLSESKSYSGEIMCSKLSQTSPSLQKLLLSCQRQWEHSSRRVICRIPSDRQAHNKQKHPHRGRDRQKTRGDSRLQRCTACQKKLMTQRDYLEGLVDLEMVDLMDDEIATMELSHPAETST
jgi:hypothetical protein